LHIVHDGVPEQTHVLELYGSFDKGGLYVYQVLPLDFEERRSCEGAEVLEPDSTRDSLPVALQKRYVLGPTELDFLVKESLKSVQLPYRLDEDDARPKSNKHREPDGKSSALQLAST